MKLSEKTDYVEKKRFGRQVENYIYMSLLVAYCVSNSVLEAMNNILTHE